MYLVTAEMVTSGNGRGFRNNSHISSTRVRSTQS